MLLFTWESFIVLLLSKKLKLIHKKLYYRLYSMVVKLGLLSWEEQSLKVFGNKILRKIFETKRDEITGEWWKLHSAELHVLCSPPNIIRNHKSTRLRWAGHVARMEQFRNAYRILAGKPEGKTPLGRLKHWWEGNIRPKVDLREVGCDSVNWIDLTQDRDQWRAYVRVIMNLRVP